MTLAPLTDEEERELAGLIKSGDQRAIDKLILANQGFVISTAKQYQGKGVELDDLVSEGNIAMMLCARKWDPDKEPRFVKYAVWHIREAMEKAIGASCLVPSSKFQVPGGSGSSLAQADKFQVPNGIKMRSMDAPLRTGHSRTLGETMPQRGTKNIADEADEVTFGYGIENGLRQLSEREQKVIVNYYGIGTSHMTMVEIAEMMGLKRERVRQIRKKAERKLRKPMREMTMSKLKL